MKRWFALLLSCFTALPLFAAGQLNLFIYSEYIDPDLVKEFERKFDCRVTIDLYEDESGLLAKLQGGGAAQFDVAVPPGNIVPALIKLKLIAPLRTDKIPNRKHIDTQFLNPPYDPGNQFTVPYQWGTVGLYARKDKDGRTPDSWSVLFDPAKQTGPFILIDSMRDTIGAALKYQGHSLNSTDPQHLRAARDLLLATKKRSLGFEVGVGARNKVLAKAATVGVTWSGDAARGTQQDPATAYVIPKEGSQVWVDNLVVCAKAPHRDLAEQFINFILEPEIGGRLANFTRFATPNQAARAFVRAEDLKNPAIYPPAEMMKKLEFLKDLGRDTRLYDEVWTQVKAK